MPFFHVNLIRNRLLSPAFDIIPMTEESYIIDCCPKAPWHPYEMGYDHPAATVTGCVRASEVVALNGEQYLTREMFRDLNRTSLENGGGSLFATDGKYVVGWISFAPKPFALKMKMHGWEHIGEPNPEDLVVVCLLICHQMAPEMRQKGIGRTLVNELFHWAESRGFRRIDVYKVPAGYLRWDGIHSHNATTPFWRNMGFRISKVVPPPPSWSSWEVRREMIDTDIYWKKGSLRREAVREYILEVEAKADKIPWLQMATHYNLGLSVDAETEGFPRQKSQRV